jgi:hypothetical protein
MWKGNSMGTGLNPNEITLTPANVNPDQFGLLGTFKADGLVMAQPLYVCNLDMGSGGKHNVVIVATENDSVYAIDVDSPAAAPLWQRSYLGNGVTPAPDTTNAVGGEVGITGTHFLDSSTNILYFVTAVTSSGTVQHWLRSIDVRTGNDAGAGSMLIQASVPGDGIDSVNGQITFNPKQQLQRVALSKVNGSILVGWGSFSDDGIYHGWLMAFDASTLKFQAVFNPTTQNQPQDHGSSGAFWQGGAGPAIDANGNIYLNSGNGSFNANQGGNNYGDTMLKLQLTPSGFQIVDWFTPSSEACMDFDDLELGSGGVVLLPTDFTNGASLSVTYSKEGRLFMLNTSTLGKFNPAGDQITQEFMIGEQTCADPPTSDTEGPTWNRLYGNASYWNGNVYAGASNLGLKQYQFQDGMLNPTPFATSTSMFGTRGANTVVSSNGNKDAIVWAYEKTNGGLAILHAYDATSVSHELYNTMMAGDRDELGQGIAFAVPVVVDGRVIAAYDKFVAVFGLLD